MKFILLDGSPHNVIDWDTMATLDGEDPNYDIKDNVYSIFYAEEEAGFYAGYASVKEGMRDLGFKMCIRDRCNSKTFLLLNNFFMIC